MERLAFSAAEAAQILGISTSSVYKLVEAGVLAKVPHLGSRVLIARVELERFAGEGLKTPPPFSVSRAAS